MTDRIVNTEGRYAPEALISPVSDPIDAGTLPQITADPYQDVDIHDFSSAGTLDRGRILLMAQIAESRGDGEAALRWKQHGIEHQQKESDAAQGELMHRMLHPQHAPMSKGPIIQARSDLPWDNDETYVTLRDDLGAAKAKLDQSHPGTSDYTEAGVEVANLTTALSDRQDAVRQSALDTGLISEMDLRSLAAQQGLVDKAGAVIGIFAQGGE